MYRIILGLNYLTDGGIPNDDRLYTTLEDSYTAPKSRDAYLNQKEYLTPDQIGASIAFKYFHLFTKPAIRGYVSLKYNYIKA